MSSGVYGIFCVESEKLYVGSACKSKRSIHNRICEHFAELKRQAHANPHLQNSFNKYGINKFLTFIIELCPKDLCLSREQFYIDLYSPEFNIAKCTTAPMLGRTHTSKSKELISKNNARHNLGKPQSPETKLKNIKSNGGTLVYCVELDKVFLGCGEAAKALSLHKRNISSVLKGRLKTTGGYHFLPIEIKEAV